MNPQALGKYQLIKKLATGGMAEVWLARQTGIEGFKKEVVVKRILPHLADDPEFVQMFLNEARIAARFTHPNIAQIFEFGKDEPSGAYYIAMEFIRGEDLGRVMRKAWSTGQWIARPLAVRIVAACCEGLYYAHTQVDEQGRPLRVVHRDISPQNILISFDGGVKLVDFGIAKASDVASMTKSGAIKGKFAYMSPEQASGKPLDHRTDIFAIGLVLYELLTGVRPLKRDSELATLQAALECGIEPPSAVADVPGELDDVVMRALAKAADDRYRDARLFQMALEEFLVSQRWVATSVQISELMEMLFADRIAEEKRLGHANPPSEELVSGHSAPGAPPPPIPRKPEVRPSRTAMRAESQPLPAAAPEEPRNETKPMSSLRRPSQPEAPAAEQSWEAPPGEAPPRRNSLSGVSAARGTSSQRSLSGTGRRMSQQAAPVVDTEERPAMEELEVEQEPAPEPPRRTSTGGTPRRKTSSGVRTRDGDAEPSNASRKPGEYSLSSGRRRSSLAEMPEPPPPRPRDDDDEDRRPPADEADRALARAAARERRGGAVRGLVGLLIAGAVMGGAWVKRDAIVKLLAQRAADSDYFVAVETNLPVRVLVRHQESEKQGSEPQVLGESPLARKSGVHPGDTVILESKSIGAYYETEVRDDLAIGETQKIQKEFRKGRLRLRVSPERKVGSLQVFRDGQQVGSFPGLDIELVEGKHQLELRGDKLKRPAAVEVTVKGNLTVDSKNFDLAANLVD